MTSTRPLFGFEGDVGALARSRRARACASPVLPGSSGVAAAHQDDRGDERCRRPSREHAVPVNGASAPGTRALVTNASPALLDRCFTMSSAQLPRKEMRFGRMSSSPTRAVIAPAVLRTIQPMPAPSSPTSVR